MSSPLLEVEGLKKLFPMRGGVFRRVRGFVRAVDGVELMVGKGETVGLVGESGCGKTTLGRCIIRLYRPSEGSILFSHNGSSLDLSTMKDRELKSIRPKIQYIFQDPYSSLNSRMTIRDVLTEPMRINRIGNSRTMLQKSSELLERVGLRAEMLNRYPHEFSGGQRQRIVVARALALDPELVICDEPVSALDVSVQSQVLNLLKDLQHEFGLTYIFIAHNLSVVNYISDRVMVMYLGKIVESAKAEDLYSTPLHPYTEALLSSIPLVGRIGQKNRVMLRGSVPSAAAVPPGCRFHPRCSYAVEECSVSEPELEELIEGSGHVAACIRARELSLKGFDEESTKTVI